MQGCVFQVGAKSRNIGYLKGKVPSWIGIPTSVAIPFGVFEHVLSDESNKVPHIISYILIRYHVTYLALQLISRGYFLCGLYHVFQLVRYLLLFDEGISHALRLLILAVELLLTYCIWSWVIFILYNWSIILNMNFKDAKSNNRINFFKWTFLNISQVTLL